MAGIATLFDPARVRALNDAFRRSLTGGQVVVTAGVAALPETTRAAVLAAVRSFDAFTPDNDPLGEHDFGEVEADGARVFWKIDAYDRDLREHSPDSADLAVTTKVLTIMLAEEY
ncbi:DUF3768 domain-containing protein [Methylobacterium trifolii]|uniref:DUF3768 domain-containing protein n=1 Tax=Methylobacterium trifolii TaxID=1003092 RepID=A0ABQ4U3X2_9HYPH|nr:DUF3768 domain-containing protein [Methylobacterium trifolii]GJE62110.1 hypothetical protein MPOCJGCO_4240 [Methylobacterium trifolii]